MALSDQIEIRWLNFLFRAGGFAKAANLYLALFTGDPTDAATGPEVSGAGTGYARIAVPVADASWTPPVDAAGAQAVENAIELEFAAAVAGWGTPSHWGLFDAVTAGNLWIHGAIGGTLRAVLAGDDPVSFAPGALRVTMGGALADYAEALMLNHMLRSAEFAKPANVYLALHGADPTDAGNVGEFTEASYARASVAVADAQWTAPAPSGVTHVVQNVNRIAWPTPLTAWGTYTHLSVKDAATAGNTLYQGPVAIPRAINASDNPPEILAGALTIGIS